MKQLFFLLFMMVFFTSCNNSNEPKQENSPRDTFVKKDTEPLRDTVEVDKPASKPYSNERFRNVTVEKVGENEYLVKGQAQVFEASFSWVIEDGHNELKQGHEMTDAGAPAWGNFSFRVQAKKERSNSVLHLILYEASAKDGSRQHLLPIPLR
ncbi:Gmad2 immunoglobulin-like domain-containing protein [Aridibaculum aurantiacum]|uniref:Gmad2 immunoglobulin-like domain-containing protein n=1 Tax=Aridibaculum aurantiacum TaxID=2810307 RepID=UPI001A95C6E5|nr:Gmad2 immunoglobulin-like domain-containing protein [Aridibaculum aurantiacum]